MQRKQEKIYDGLTVLLADGADRQTLPLARSLHQLDNGYTTRFANKRFLNKKIRDSKIAHVNFIKEIVKSSKVDVVITTSDDTAEQLSLMKSELSNHTKIAVVDPELFYLAYDKNKTMKVCMENDLPCPKTFFGISLMTELPFDEFCYPMVVKPRKSYGAIGYHKIENEEEMKQFCEKIKDDLDNYVFQEYIPQTDIQYECAMFVDESNEIKTACVFSKNRWFPVNGGSSTCNVTVNRPDIIESCTKLLKLINWRGAADIDLIQDPRDGKAKIMEINPRVSGSIKVVINAGVNIVNQILQLALGHQVEECLDYKNDVRLRCFHTDLLWFIKSKNRFHSTPSWFSWKNTSDQIWSWVDPLPFFTFSIQALFKYKSEMKKRT